MMAGRSSGNCFLLAFNAFFTVFSENSFAVSAVTSTFILSSGRTAWKSKSAFFTPISGFACSWKQPRKNEHAANSSYSVERKSRPRNRRQNSENPGCRLSRKRHDPTIDSRSECLYEGKPSGAFSAKLKNELDSGPVGIVLRYSVITYPAANV